jgi:hypothetical protein
MPQFCVYRLLAAEPDAGGAITADRDNLVVGAQSMSGSFTVIFKPCRLGMN